jgi:glycolate oxidase FAD binding subunit
MDDAAVSLQRLRDQVRDAQSRQQPLCIAGSGSKDFYGEVSQGEPLRMGEHSGIVSYEPTELVITARAGTPLVEVQQVLAGRNQMLAFEPPAFGPGATLGGVVAAGLSGPRRVSAGALKDFVLGAVLLSAAGEALHFGGQVMKNVAGYDVSRLLCGSLGVLGPLLEVSIKVLPVPPLELGLRGHCDEAQALAWLNTWAGQPLPISASYWADGELTLRLSGARAAVLSAQVKLQQTAGLSAMGPEQTIRFWQDVREQKLSAFDAAQLWRLSLPSTAPALDLHMFGEPGCAIEWGGAVRWLRLATPQSNEQALSVAHTLREIARAHGGTASLWRGADKSAGVFHPLDPVNLRIHQRLKAEFDPLNIFNRGRLSPQL